MVKFKVERIFDYPVEDVVKLFMESGQTAYDVSELQNVTQFKILKEEDKGEKVASIKEWCAHAQIPKALQHIISPKMLTWLEHSVWDRPSKTYTFEIEPHYMKNKVECSGKSTYRDKGGKCARNFEMKLDVKIPILGQIFENVVIGLMKDNEAQDFKLCTKALKDAYSK